MRAHRVMLGFALLLLYGSTYSQQGRNIFWSIRIEKISLHEANLVITARIQPGWHLYSQHLEDGGPQPTRITFTADDQYALSGFAENGEPNTYFDEIYEMNVTWYSNKVDFVGKLKVSDPVMKLKGVIEYMVCSADMCIPDQIPIVADVDLTREEP